MVPYMAVSFGVVSPEPLLSSMQQGDLAKARFYRRDVFGHGFRLRNLRHVTLSVRVELHATTIGSNGQRRISTQRRGWVRVSGGVTLINLCQNLRGRYFATAETSRRKSRQRRTSLKKPFAEQSEERHVSPSCPYGPRLAVPR